MIFLDSEDIVNYSALLPGFSRWSNLIETALNLFSCVFAASGLPLSLHLAWSTCLMIPWSQSFGPQILKPDEPGCCLSAPPAAQWLSVNQRLQALARNQLSQITLNHPAPPLFFNCSFTQYSMVLKYHQLCRERLWPCSQTIKARTDTVSLLSKRKRKAMWKETISAKRKKKNCGVISSFNEGRVQQI